MKISEIFNLNISKYYRSIVTIEGEETVLAGLTEDDLLAKIVQFGMDNFVTDDDTLSWMLERAMPKQSNGHDYALPRFLGNCFWYSDLNTYAERRQWVMEIITKVMESH